MAGPNDQDVWAGRDPRWTVVPDADLAKAPYVSICQVKATSEDGSASYGSGWIRTDGVVVTAAHVLRNADFEGSRCFVRWQDSAGWKAADRFDTHPLYDGEEGSPSDVGRIFGAPKPANTGLATGHLERGLVEAVGYRDGKLVTHKGAGKVVGPFINYDADSGPGHSGCPVISGGKAVGLHVAGAGTSAQFLPPAHQAQMTYLNAAVSISGNTLNY